MGLANACIKIYNEVSNTLILSSKSTSTCWINYDQSCSILWLHSSLKSKQLGARGFWGLCIWLYQCPIRDLRDAQQHPYPVDRLCQAQGRLESWAGVRWQQCPPRWCDRARGCHCLWLRQWRLLKLHGRHGDGDLLCVFGRVWFVPIFGNLFFHFLVRKFSPFVVLLGASLREKRK